MEQYEIYHLIFYGLKQYEGELFHFKMGSRSWTGLEPDWIFTQLNLWSSEMGQTGNDSKQTDKVFMIEIDIHFKDDTNTKFKL